MRIDKRLHLVIPVYADEEGSDVIAYVHSAPLSEEVIDQYFMVLGQSFQEIAKLGVTQGPRYAMRVLKHVAQQMNAWLDSGDGRPGVERGLVEEMRRLAMVMILDKGKWDAVPLHVAVERGALSVEDRTEVENAIAFFTVVSAGLPRSQRPAMLRLAAEMWGAQVTSSDFTAWSSSLRTSSATGSSGARSPAPARDEPAPANATVGGKPSRVAF